MVSRAGRIVAVLWLAGLLACWANNSPLAWPPGIDVAGLIPFSRGSDYAGWYHWMALSICTLAGWAAWRVARRR